MNKQKTKLDELFKEWKEHFAIPKGEMPYLDWIARRDELHAKISREYFRRNA